MAGVSLTWLGHGSLRIDSPGGKRIYLDPWFGGPTVPEAEQTPERCDIVALTHGHFDHVDGVKALDGFSPKLVAGWELSQWFAANGHPDGGAHGMGKGGTQVVDGITFSAVHANHSSSTPDGAYAGEPLGYVIQFENGYRLYVSGDTNVHSDMALIGRIYQPDAAVLSIGDQYTMGPREAAVALELLGPTVKKAIGIHWGTFPLLTGTPAKLRELLTTDVEVLDLAPGDTVEL